MAGTKQELEQLIENWSHSHGRRQEGAPLLTAIMIKKQCSQDNLFSIQL